MPNPRIAGLISEKLRNGLQHPGDPANDQRPMTIALPIFKTAGMPPDMAEQVNKTAQLIAEGVVHAIENDGSLIVDVPKLSVEDLKTHYWITVEDSGIHFLTPDSGVTAAQARVFAAALLSAAATVEHAAEVAARAAAAREGMTA